MRVVDSRFVLGLDIGQRRDHSAIAVVERVTEQAYGNDWIRITRMQDSVRVKFTLRHVERIPLGTPYEKVIQRAAKVFDLLGDQRDLVADATGVGAAVVEGLQSVCRDVIPVVITSGKAAHKEGNFWMVPRKDLLGTVSVMLEKKELKIAKGLKLRVQLERELLELRERGAGAPGHDDMAMAVALACWRARWRTIGRLTGV